jgi:hypothetical protein
VRGTVAYPLEYSVVAVLVRYMFYRIVLPDQCDVLGEKYLGLPTEVGYATSGVFEYLRAQVRGTIDGWCVRQASCAGREVLIKSVAQAVLANFHHTLCWRCVQTTLEN